MENASASQSDTFSALERDIGDALQRSGETVQMQFDCLRFYVQYYKSCFDVAEEIPDDALLMPLDDRCN